jgi:hypothetical protein
VLGLIDLLELASMDFHLWLLRLPREYELKGMKWPKLIPKR